MKQASRLNILLAAVALALALVTIHLALELRQERARVSELLRTGEGDPAPQDQTLAADSLPVIASGEPAREAPASRAGAADPGVVAVAKARLAELQDPRDRAERARHIASFVRDGYQEAAMALDWSPAEFDQFVQFRVELALSAWQRRLECTLVPECDSSTLHKRLGDEADLETEQFLGTTRHARLQDWVESASERTYVDIWRRRLVANASVADDTALELASRLHEVRRDFEEQAKERGEQMNQYVGNGLFSIFSAVPEGVPDVSTMRLESARRYTEAIKRQAATVLGPEQQLAFSEMVDDSLRGMRFSERDSQRNREIAERARRQAED
jgi:hypothetical protein